MYETRCRECTWIKQALTLHDATIWAEYHRDNTGHTNIETEGSKYGN